MTVQSTLATPFSSFEDLRVEELEPRLEFTAPIDGFCVDDCSVYYLAGPGGIYDGPYRCIQLD